MRCSREDNSAIAKQAPKSHLRNRAAAPTRFERLAWLQATARSHRLILACQETVRVSSPMPSADQFFKAVSCASGHKDMQAVTETGVVRPVMTATNGQPQYGTAKGRRRLIKKIDQRIVYFVDVKEQLGG